MSDRSNELRILQVSTSDTLGGAELVALNLHRAYRQSGYPAWLVVGRKRSREEFVLSMPGNSRANLWARAFRFSSRWLEPLLGRVRGVSRIQSLLQGVAEPRRWRRALRGHEDFSFPHTFRLLEMTPELPTILHCHNLHGGYFDLRALPRLSSQVPTFLTLHDAWLLSGHCAHSLGCDRWQTGCGDCPDLGLYPAIRRDATAYNWKLKADIYARSRLYIATPCQWLLEMVKRSALASAMVEARVIYNGVDLEVFRPADRPSVRASLGIPEDAQMLLFAASGVRSNPWKDYGTLRATVAQVADHMEGKPVLCVALGEDSPVEYLGRAEIRFVPYQRDRAVVARYYQSADVYVHPARIETMSLSITEALACGTPVVATAVGGVPEQVREAYNGFEVPLGDARAMAAAIIRLLDDETLRRSLSSNAAQDARERFDLRRQAEAYISWYQEVLSEWRPARPLGEGKVIGS